MDSLDNNTLAFAAAVAVIVVAAIVGLAWSRLRSARLRQRFGPEYDVVVKRMGSRARGEAELRRRLKRVARLELVALSPAEAQRFAQAWIRLQGSFVDDPKGVLIEADRLVRDLLAKRGYPMADFESQAGDISVDHPIVVNNFRAAQRIVSLDQRGEATTEDMRRAVVHFRALFDELLGASKVRDEVAASTRLAA